jgi:hypothetical protein
MHSFISCYKLLCGEPCPRCKVVIIRTGGCKYMKCEKCQYEFCWYCLDEFYTEYHYYYTNCPFRYCLFHSIEVMLACIVLLKIIAVSPLAQYLGSRSIYFMYNITYGLGIMFFGMKAFLNKRKHSKAQKKIDDANRARQ